MNFKPFQTNFTGGEITPKLGARQDIAKWQNSVKVLENGVPLIFGGVTRRNGSRYIAEAKYHDKKVRLLPYVFNRDQSYIIELGDHYFRVYKDGNQIQSGGVAVEVETPFDESVLFNIRYAQGADTLFLTHKDYPPHRIQRIDDTHWVCEQLPYTNQPKAEIGNRSDSQVDLSALTGVVNVSCADDVFIASDVGRIFSYAGSYGEIISFVSAKSIKISVYSDFFSLFVPGGRWVIEGTPITAIKPSCDGKGAETITVEVPTGSISVQSKVKITSYSLNGSTLYLTIPDHGYALNSVVTLDGFIPTEWNGNKKVIEVVDNDTFAVTVKETQGNVSLGQIVFYTTKTKPPAFRPSDIGKFIELNNGLLEISEVNSTTKVTCLVKKELSSAVEVPPFAWVLKDNVWNVYDGYPTAVALYEQRLILGGSKSKPTTVWMSRIGAYFDFLEGIEDDEAFSFALSGDQYNPISHIVQTKTLLILTYGGESTVWGGQEKAITPTNIQVKTQSIYGSSDVTPCRVGNELFFAQRANRKIRAMSYYYTEDAYNSSDITTYSEHITQSGITDMCYQQELDSVVWIVRNDGQLVSLTASKEQEVFAWARHLTDGLFQSVASIPSVNKDELYICVERVIDGQKKKCIELFHDDVFMDSFLTLESNEGDGSYLWEGLSHLEGKKVEVLTEKGLHKRLVVTNGKINTDGRYKKLIVGLPYTTTIRTLTPEFMGQTGSLQGNQMKNFNVRPRLLNTIGCYINGKAVDFRKFGGNALNNLDPVTTEKPFPVLGWNDGFAEVVIEQRDPLPFHILGLITSLVVNQ